MDFLRPILLLVSFYAVTGCASQRKPATEALRGAAQSALVGEFVDDYGINYSITEKEWHQHPEARYRIVRWRPGKQYLIAQNDTENPSDAGLWTRIDWMKLSDMPPYEWAFCLSAYASPTAAAAEETTLANRDMPRTGCNGHPFSRMRIRNATSR